jgi:hypothetical protein
LRLAIDTARESFTVIFARGELRLKSGVKKMQSDPTILYVGKRETIIAELGGLTHIYKGAFLIQPDGPASYDAEGADTLADTQALVVELTLAYPNIEVRWI